MTDIRDRRPGGPATRRREGRGAFAVERRALFVVAAAAVLLIAGYFAYDALSHMTVTVNGSPVRLPTGATVAVALGGSDLKALRGDLIAVDGSLLRPRGGRAPRILVSGRRVPPATVLVPGARLTAQRGADVTEPVTRRVRAIDATAAPPEGEGPFVVVERPGLPGVDVTKVGKISGTVVARRVERPPVEPLLVVRTIDPGNVVALTFDDGPNPANTPRFLEVLKRYDVKATFFQLGASVALYPKVARAVRDGGHEIGNHSYYHWDWDKVSAANIGREIRWTSDAIQKATGARPSWLRPPGGVLNAKVYAVTGRLGVQMVLWDVDTNDWQKPSPQVIAARAVNGAKPGAVILMHDAGGDRSRTLAALPTIIQGLRKRGFALATVSQLWAMSQR